MECSRSTKYAVWIVKTTTNCDEAAFESPLTKVRIFNKNKFVLDAPRDKKNKIIVLRATLVDASKIRSVKTLKIFEKFSTLSLT